MTGRLNQKNKIKRTSWYLPNSKLQLPFTASLTSYVEINSEATRIPFVSQMKRPSSPSSHPLTLITSSYSGEQSVSMRAGWIQSTVFTLKHTWCAKKLLKLLHPHHIPAFPLSSNELRDVSAVCQWTQHQCLINILDLQHVAAWHSFLCAAFPIILFKRANYSPPAVCNVHSWWRWLM